MRSLVLPLSLRSSLGGAASLLILGLVIGGFLFLQKAIAAEKARQRVSEAQLKLEVEEWRNIWSRKRRLRVLSRLPAPEGEDIPTERFLRISGQSRAALIAPLGLPLAVILVAVALFVFSTMYDPAKPKVHPHHKHKKATPQLFDYPAMNMGDMRELLFWLFVVALVVSLLWAGYSIARWGGTYFALSDYRFYRIWVYPTWMFWVNIDPKEVELHMLTSKGYDQNVIGKTFGGFGTLEMDTAGLGDDELFNRIPMVPDVESFAMKLSDAQRSAAPPVMLTQADRTHDVLVDIRDLLQARGNVAVQPVDTTADAEQQVLIDETQEFPPHPTDPETSP